ncbi:MAG: isoprenylcysteine carboxylmethyltransferase family protein [Verrucomicrobia bacterium]|nr:isoprenylcysteine carboxylmethyltransferase family protein [Verrucomicrobiota bacterium]
MARPKNKKLRVPVAYAFALILLVVLGISRSAWEERSEMVCTAFLVSGIVLAGIGSLGRLWCSLYIAGWKKKELVTLGPYSMSRNPLYFFSFVGTLGVGLATETLVVPLILSLFFLLFYPVTIRNEEAKLSGLYGAEFEEYVKTVPRFLPRPSLLKEPDERQVNPIIFRKHLFHAIWFIWLIGILEFIEALHETNILPTFLKLY